MPRAHTHIGDKRVSHTYAAGLCALYAGSDIIYVIYDYSRGYTLCFIVRKHQPDMESLLLLCGGRKGATYWFTSVCELKHDRCSTHLTPIIPNAFCSLSLSVYNVCFTLHAHPKHLYQTFSPDPDLLSIANAPLGKRHTQELRVLDYSDISQSALSTFISLLYQRD